MIAEQSRHEVLDRLQACGIVPIVTVDDPADITPIADALVAGGITAIEITLRTAAGLEAIGRLSARDDILIGAGTVLTAAQVDESARRGARFVVSPGLQRAVVERAAKLGLTALPGVATATELQQALDAGLTHVKLFPAEQLGGHHMISALAAPFPQVSFMPSGGVTPDNLDTYLAHPSVFAAGCSWITPREALAERDFARVAALAAAARDVAKDSARRTVAPSVEL